MPAKLKNLISLYDCIGWIPTIRGCLSLDLIDDADCILGDVDKYSVRFKTTDRFRAQHYLIASALITKHNPFIVMSGLLAFVFTCMKLITIFMDIPQSVKIEKFPHIDFTIENNELLLWHLVLLASLTAIGYAIYIIPRSQILSRQFKPKQRQKKRLFQNSILRLKRFSFLYDLHILFYTVRLRIKNSLYVALVTLFYLFCLLVAIFCLSQLA